jgi:hypothetical protein
MATCIAFSLYSLTNRYTAVRSLPKRIFWSFLTRRESQGVQYTNVSDIATRPETSIVVANQKGITLYRLGNLDGEARPVVSPICISRNYSQVPDSTISRVDMLS